MTGERRSKALSVFFKRHHKMPHQRFSRRWGIPAYKAFLIQAIADRLAHVFRGRGSLLTGKGHKAQARAQILRYLQLAICKLCAARVNGLRITELVHNVQRAVQQRIHRRDVGGLHQRDRFDQRAQSLIIAAIVLIGLHDHRSRRRVIADQLIGAGGHHGMAGIARFRVQEGLFQQRRREVPLNVRTPAIIHYLAVRRNHADGIGRYIDQHQLIEVRQRIAAQGDAKGHVIHQPQTRQHGLLSAVVVVVAVNLPIQRGIAAQLRHGGTGLHQHAEDVILRSDRRTVVVAQAVLHLKLIELVAVAILQRSFQRHRAFVHRIGAAGDRHGAVAVQHVAHVHVRGVGAEQIGGKAASDLRHRAHRDLAAPHQRKDDQRQFGILLQVQRLPRAVPRRRVIRANRVDTRVQHRLRAAVRTDFQGRFLPSITSSP